VDLHNLIGSSHPVLVLKFQVTHYENKRTKRNEYESRYLGTYLVPTTPFFYPGEISPKRKLKSKDYKNVLIFGRFQSPEMRNINIYTVAQIILLLEI